MVKCCHWKGSQRFWYWTQTHDHWEETGNRQTELLTHSCNTPKLQTAARHRFGNTFNTCLVLSRHVWLSMFNLFIPPCSSSTRPIPSSEPKKNNHWLPLLDHSDSPHVPLCYLPVSQEFICIPQDHKSHFYLTGLNNYDRNMSPSFLRTSILIRLLLCFIAATWCNPPHSCWAPSQLCAE